MNNRRLDYDAKLNKVQKSKKEDSKLEEDARVSQEKYLETLELITEQMIHLNSQDENQLASFSKLIDDHLRYHEECANQFKALKDQVSNLEIKPLRAHNRIPVISARSSTASISKIDKQTSRSNLGSQEIPRVGSNRSINSQQPLQQLSIEPEKDQVEAIFDFKAENANELTIRPGDIISIVHEVDEGWLYGTVEGSDRSGIFPRTYTKYNY